MKNFEDLRQIGKEFKDKNVAINSWSFTENSKFFILSEFETTCSGWSSYKLGLMISSVNVHSCSWLI